MTAVSDRLDAIQKRLDTAAPGAITITPSDIAWLRETARKQQAALDAVRAVHEPVDALMYSGSQQRKVQVCTGCGTDDGNWQRWPCPTIRALEAKP